MDVNQSVGSVLERQSTSDYLENRQRIEHRKAAQWIRHATRNLAAGAMLTMIAETMLPEAYLKGGSLVGLSTLFGFLTAILSSTL
ncbi:hypothetical protein [Magnetospira sp. QH-2]|uniref:hypothetical protein n=1 Tax=Magnetospira sp. (strain QH-2) TaxID=1288970 RepID=UPI0003E81324|nr:hypothetical protein [Magnetospira sp. QH-2]CCQ73790.1 Protein of unknown function [Magnetospira sp. QH-2]